MEKITKNVEQAPAELVYMVMTQDEKATVAAIMHHELTLSQRLALGAIFQQAEKRAHEVPATETGTEK